MKAFFIAATVLVSLSAFSAHAGGSESTGGSSVCSASAIYIDGTFREFVRVECDGPYAGKCVSENPKNSAGWDVVEMSVCDAQAKAQN
jgi:hypothetical protein